MCFVQLELAFKEQLETEERARVAEKERQEREKLEARKQREVQRITDVSIIKNLKRHLHGFQYFDFAGEKERRRQVEGQ